MICFSMATSPTGCTVSKLNRRLSALDISFTPLSLVFAVPMTLKPGRANSRPSSPSSGMFRTLSLSTLIKLSCTSAGVRVISSKRVNEVGALAASAGITQPLDAEAAGLLAVTYHELREGISAQGQRIEKPSAVMSTAEAISVYFQTLMTAWYYGDGRMDEKNLVENSRPVSSR